MKIREVEGVLIKCLDEQLGKEGFQFQKGPRAFYRASPVGSDVLQVMMHKHGDLVDVEIQVAVRHDEIEHLLTTVISTLTIGDPTLYSREMVEGRKKGDSATVGIQIGNIEGPTTKDWGIIAEADIEPACLDMLEMIHRDAEPYFAQFTTTRDFLEKLGRDDSQSWRWGGIRHYRAMKAAAAAYLLRDRVAFDCVRMGKEQFLVDRKDEFGLRQFRPFAQYLAEHWEDRQTGA